MMADKHKLTWHVGPDPVISQRPLPEEIKREFILSSDGMLELLVALPEGVGGAGVWRPPLLFVHGGFGTATAYMNFLSFFASHGHPSYSVSLRGHGASYHPGFWNLYWTGKHALALDIVTAIDYIRESHGIRSSDTSDTSSPSLPSSNIQKGIILVGHSSGGGLSQYILSSNLSTVGGLVALAAVPGFGSYGVYWNWFVMDPWFVARMYLRDFFHPRSPLSSTDMVHNAFFSFSFPREQVRAVEAEMPETESIVWPLTMMTRFVEPKKVLERIVPVLKGGRKILVVAGGCDRLMGVTIMENLAAWYRGAVEGVLGGGGGGGEGGGEEEVVRFEKVEGSGHDLMRDVKWKECAQVVLEWLQN